ncbi:Gfo/Idh/MocA family protein [Paenibacillus glycinis]|uniref:Gfo/Idh/MocA family oxidoreductase n=1 Tax=Paenibacillus glycinis TaxID=2697035 RepID=A0ABW9XNL0_9BACL|nr:Gfo/Idh/MocA family oxidoreductase [Paenibacillus glycinis]NBD24156.1 Gfo/Idh/MocA family oxidoreductase [Paenibacillus glycinis]
MAEQEERIIRWGILGLGGISNSFTGELVNIPGAKVCAAAARSLDKAQAFADKFGIPRAYGSYEELAQDPEIDIVYVGTLHPAHRDNVMTCLRGGKAVLCEKPFTMNADEAKEIADYARERGLFVMEAMWTRFLPPVVKAREWLADGRIGEVKLLKAEFGFDAGWNPEGRLLNKELGGGTLLDAGIYPISFASMVFGAQPSRIVSSARIGETGVDEQYSVLFEYANGAIASLHGAVRVWMNNDAWLYGTKGKIHLPEFLSAKTATLYPNDGEPETFQDDRTFRGQNFQALEAMACLRAGKTGSAVMPAEETVDIMGTMDAIRAQWGLTYNGK